MIQSMTGFATKIVTITSPNAQEKAHITIVIKALNSRFFDTTCKLHYALSSLENTIITKAKKSLHRGHVYVTMYITNANALRGSVQASLATVSSYLESINKIRELYDIKEPVTLSHILQLPNIFSVEETEISESIATTIYAAIDELLNSVIKDRIQEGAALKKDLEQRVAIMEQEIKQIAIDAEAILKRQKDKVHATLKEIEADENILAQAQKSALYTMLDKLDLHEEIVRFKSHLENLKEQLVSKEVELGKRIDFILQELAREINTISAKCSDSAISKHAINVKVELEKAREQTQNIV